jgi:hypothetical protein
MVSYDHWVSITLSDILNRVYRPNLHLHIFRVIQDDLVVEQKEEDRGCSENGILER